MTKKLFPEHEMYLLENWSDVVEFEASIASVRERYQKILEDVLESVGSTHKNLDCQGFHLTNGGGYTLNIGLGKRAWSKDDKWPTGIWLENLWIENLVTEDENLPGGAIWIDPPKDVSLDLAEAVDRLQQLAKTILPVEDFSHLDCKCRKSTAFISYPFRQSRRELRDMLWKDDAKDFGECLVKHFEALIPFIDVLDEIFKTAKRSRK